MSTRIKVLVVDDSAVVRQTLSEILSSDPGIEVVATASDPLVAAERMRREAPDVITLDIEMPRMDGLTFLEKLMAQHPIPVVVCSSLAGAGSAVALRALELGAVEVMAKPSVVTRESLKEARIELCDRVKAAAWVGPAKVRALQRPSRPIQAALQGRPLGQPRLDADVVVPDPVRRPAGVTEPVVLMGASTGGTQALGDILPEFPEDCPPVVIVQHMPEHFTRAFSDRLDGLCRAHIKEAENGDVLERGLVLVAPGGRHLLLQREGAHYAVEVRGGPLVSRHRPSVDVLFRSGALYAGANAIAVIMTGMGDDGARGMRELFDAGAHTVAQDEASCVVFGMPDEAIKRGAVHRVAPLSNIVPEVLRAARERRQNGAV
ncbi:MAG: chemotaxis response regulator protein-glutamate methylesterase [Desulfovibrionaceae bacterium]